MNAKQVNKKALKLARDIRAIGQKPYTEANLEKYSSRQYELLQLCIDALDAGLRFTEEKEQ